MIEFFISGENRLRVQAELPELEQYPTVLFCTGGGKTQTIDRFTELQKKLAHAGIASVNLEFSGLGESTGKFEESSLSLRISEALDVIQWFEEKFGMHPWCAYGVSMGTYVALGVVHETKEKFSKLALTVPAAYAAEAHNVPFTEQFTNILRTPNSWQSSLSFQWMSEYTGALQLYIAENDEVVPREITDTYKEKAVNVANLDYILLPGAAHHVYKHGVEATMQDGLVEFYRR